MAASETHQAIETVFRIELARLVADLARLVPDLGLAEELAQDALVTALSEFTQPDRLVEGVPGPGADRRVMGARFNRLAYRVNPGTLMVPARMPDATASRIFA